MRHWLLVALVVLYVMIWAQNWTWFAGAIMLRAILADRLSARPQPIPA